MSLVYKKLRRIIDDLLYYIRTNPMEVFILVLMPLITGGLLTTILARFGIRLPLTVQTMLAQLNGYPSRSESSSSRSYRSASYGRENSYGGLRGFGGQVSNIVGGIGGLGTVLSMVKMFT